MAKYLVYYAARAEAEHACDCELCTAARRVNLHAVFEAIIEAKDEEAAMQQAETEIKARLDDATPPGYMFLAYTQIRSQVWRQA